MSCALEQRSRSLSFTAVLGKCGNKQIESPKHCKKLDWMKARNPRLFGPAKLSVLIWGGLVACQAASLAAVPTNSTLPPQLRPHYGGMSPLPQITGSSRSNENLRLEWRGFEGPYQVERRSGLTDTSWEPVGQPVYQNFLSVRAITNGIAFYRVSGPSPRFGGASTCGSCHTETYSHWSQSSHAQAFETLQRIGQETNSNCLVCHTTGLGLPTGYQINPPTPALADVQCENCHGPAGAHARTPDEPTLRPPVTLSSEICGGCHQDFHHPYYDEWATSGHARVTPAVARIVERNDEARTRECGVCHLGSVHVAMVKGDLLPTTPQELLQPIGCAVCHDPHRRTEYESLRHPIYSTNFYSLELSSGVPFSLQYNPRVQVCGQCHNARGADWPDTESAPHPSPQYNMLVGNIGVWGGAFEHSAHHDILRQCTECHTHPHPVEQPTPENPVKTGHGFEPRMDNCMPCHTPESATARVAITQSEFRQRLQSLKSLLDAWATNKAPENLRTRYGPLAWEYTRPGSLSLSGTNTATGPSAAEQELVPDAIKQARFNLYLVQADRSYGVHNGKYARFLLETAEGLVNLLLESP